jgi:hypothetical protein
LALTKFGTNVSHFACTKVNQHKFKLLKFNITVTFKLQRQKVLQDRPLDVGEEEEKNIKSFSLVNLLKKFWARRIKLFTAANNTKM